MCFIEGTQGALIKQMGEQSNFYSDSVHTLTTESRSPNP
jgi:hypothetical protein